MDLIVNEAGASKFQGLRCVNSKTSLEARRRLPIRFEHAG